MSTRKKSPLHDDDEPIDATRLEMRSPFAPPLPATVAVPGVERVSDETLPMKSGYRLTSSVQGFRLTPEADKKPVDISTGVAQLGSAPGNDVVLAHATVSRFHAEIRVEDQRPIVRDLGSTNGTFLDGVRVREGYLREGSVVKLGQAAVKFELLEKRHLVPISEASQFGELVGLSAPMRAAFALLEKAARTDSTLIIEGETGTGKTRAAQALHSASSRAKKPFLVVDCGAMPAALLEAELFGHEKGAFTGATARRLGVFEDAAGGTVLLDEIGELPIELQPRLLRVLEDRQIRRLGQNQWTAVDVRIVAATHRDLRSDVNSGRFRQDLYFRLAVAKVKLPALREHPEDLQALAIALLDRLGATRQKHPTLFTPGFLKGLEAATWPGNVRELRNYLERCILFEEPMPLDDGHSAKTGSHVALSGAFSDARQRALDAFERTYLEQMLKRHGGKVAAAAVEAEVDRVYLYRLLRKHGIKAR